MTLAAFIGNYFSERVAVLYVIAAVVLVVLFMYSYSKRNRAPVATPLPPGHPVVGVLLSFVPLVVIYLTAALMLIRMTPEGMWVAFAFSVGFIVIIAIGVSLFKHALSDRINKDGEF